MSGFHQKEAPAGSTRVARFKAAGLALCAVALLLGALEAAPSALRSTGVRRSSPSALRSSGGRRDERHYGAAGDEAASDDRDGTESLRVPCGAFPPASSAQIDQLNGSRVTAWACAADAEQRKIMPVRRHGDRISPAQCAAWCESLAPHATSMPGDYCCEWRPLERGHECSWSASAPVYLDQLCSPTNRHSSCGSLAYGACGAPVPFERVTDRQCSETARKRIGAVAAMHAPDCATACALEAACEVFAFSPTLAGVGGDSCVLLEECRPRSRRDFAGSDWASYRRARPVGEEVGRHRRHVARAPEALGASVATHVESALALSLEAESSLFGEGECVALSSRLQCPDFALWTGRFWGGVCCLPAEYRCAARQKERCTAGSIELSERIDGGSALCCRFEECYRTRASERGGSCPAGASRERIDWTQDRCCLPPGHTCALMGAHGGCPRGAIAVKGRYEPNTPDLCCAAGIPDSGGPCFTFASANVFGECPTIGTWRPSGSFDGECCMPSGWSCDAATDYSSCDAGALLVESRTPSQCCTAPDGRQCFSLTSSVQGVCPSAGTFTRSAGSSFGGICCLPAGYECRDSYSCDAGEVRVQYVKAASDKCCRLVS
jgi:hypothetical protein